MKVTDALIEKEKCREICYRTLSACYCMPEGEFVKGEGMENLIASLEPLCKEAAGYANEMRLALSNCTETELLVAYSKLFVGPFELIAPPYGSVYLEKGRQVMGNSTADAIQWYRKMGLAIDPGQKDVPDHVSVELEFMNFLIHKGIEARLGSEDLAIAESMADQEGFLSRHLGSWTPEFAKAVREGTDNRFYQKLADCSAAFISGDLRHVKTLRETFAQDELANH